MGTEKRYIHGMFCRFHMKPTHVFILKRIKKILNFNIWNCWVRKKIEAFAKNSQVRFISLCAKISNSALIRNIILTHTRINYEIFSTINYSEAYNFHVFKDLW